MYTLAMPTQSSKRWWDFWAACLIFLAVYTVTSRLLTAQWTEELSLPRAVALLAVILGLALGQSQFSTRITALLAALYGLFFIPWLFGLELSVGAAWTERMLNLGVRLTGATRIVLARQPVSDPILFLFLMSLLMWIVPVSAGYFVTRHASVWPAVLPLGVTILVFHHYDRLNPAGARTIAFFLLLVLLLVGRLTYLRYREDWRLSNLFMSQDVGVDLTRASIIAGIFILVVSFIIPVTPSEGARVAKLWADITRPWESVRDRFSDAFSSLQSRVETDPYIEYDNNLSLGTGAILSDTVLFEVVAPLPPSGTRYYWRARSYDQYTSTGWVSSQTVNKTFTAEGFAFTYPAWSSRSVVQADFTMRSARHGTFFTGPMTLWLSRPGEAVLAEAADGTADIAVFTARPPVKAGEGYRTEFWLSKPTIKQLRLSGTDYPDWIKERYLQLPLETSGRMIGLAEQITAGLDNPYDKAAAITVWLRKNITYTETIAMPPADVDPIEWFALDYKQGYCNYYASAEVLLLRIMGIPARMVAGYAQGDYDPEEDLYSVRERDSHAWPEVYFQGYGWVEFEPTVSQPERRLLTGDEVNGAMGLFANIPPELDPSLESLMDREGSSLPLPQVGLTPEQIRARNIAIVLAVLAGLAVLFIFWYLLYARPRLKEVPLAVRLERELERRKWDVPAWLRRWSWNMRRSTFEKAYAVLEQVITLLGKATSPAHTPAERVLAVKQLLPEADAQADILLQEYQLAQYSPYPADAQRALSASFALRQIAYRAFFRRKVTTRQ
jgi:transglutaminase-like putative cysteine protease